MARVQAAEMVLQQMQMLDQQVAPALAVAEQRLHLVERRRIDLPAFRDDRARAAARSPDECGGRVYGRWHVPTASNPSPPLREREAREREREMGVPVARDRPHLSPTSPQGAKEIDRGHAWSTPPLPCASSAISSLP